MVSDQEIMLDITSTLASLSTDLKYTVEELPIIDLVIGRCSRVYDEGIIYSGTCGFVGPGYKFNKVGMVLFWKSVKYFVRFPS